MEYISKVDLRELYGDSIGRVEPPYTDKKWLEEQYIANQMSASAIAHLVGVSHHTIISWIERFGIPKKTKAEATHLAKANHVEIVSKLKELLDGLILRDGHLGIKGGTGNEFHSGYYSQSAKYREHLEFIRDKLREYGVLSYPPSATVKIMEGKEYHGWYFSTKTYAELKIFRDRWYKPEKHIPHDFYLTPEMLLIWYIDDGCLGHPKDARPNIALAANDFSFEDRTRIVKAMARLGVYATNRPCGAVGINVGQVENFLETIGDCPKAIKGQYGYKWEV